MTNNFTFAHRDEGFDEHIDKSIRGYSDLIHDVVNLSLYFTDNDSYVVDIGCSTGKMLDRMIERHDEYSLTPKYIGYEIEDGFFDDLNTLKQKHGEKFDVVAGDVTKHLNEFPVPCSYVTSIFTMQFIERYKRTQLLHTVCSNMIKGGAFVFAEKVYIQNPQLQDMLTFSLYDHKRKTFTEKDILDKEVRLRSMLRPDYWDSIEDSLYAAGFSYVDRFWQNHAFVGAIAIK